MTENKSGTELVEIKPRTRDEDEHRITLDGGAFEELTGAEVYDPSWTTTPLRAEAGQLGKGDGPGGVQRKSLLPNALTLESSADLESDEDNDVVAGDGLDDDSIEPTSGNDVMSPQGKSIYSKGKRGAMSFLSRKNRKDSVAGSELFRVSQKPEEVATLLILLLESHFAGVATPFKASEFRAKVKAPVEDQSHHVSVAIFVEELEEDSSNLVRASIRRSRNDKMKVPPAEFQRLCEELAARYAAAKPEVTLLNVFTVPPPN
eukprot:Plantae.Rhodophyta-Palmaria_palmata.ctg3396.p1 GENE.Plantae.Rhodophyta-Palmaria_palmata.ctg3396~~Plantae.Rhodophyta-Palmaria_palmata.ctg3396.p1  ORF type:complete len:261 (+),score=42.58 Plantae.Rhodophyta-Palmaria_palmata.ctg3396:243-1025(+)